VEDITHQEISLLEKGEMKGFVIKYDMKQVHFKLTIDNR